MRPDGKNKNETKGNEPPQIMLAYCYLRQAYRAYPVVAVSKFQTRCVNLTESLTKYLFSLNRLCQKCRMCTRMLQWRLKRQE